MKRKKNKNKNLACTTILQYKINLLLTIQYHIGKLCLMCNNSRMTFMFEKSEPDNTLLFTMFQAIFFVDWRKFRNWSFRKSSGMLGITANGLMHSLMEYTLSSNKPNNAVRSTQTFDNKSWTTTGQFKSQRQQTTQKCNWTRMSAGRQFPNSL